MKVFSGKNGKKGFTLVEVILVVAVLVIAMGIAVPGVVGVSKNLKIAKLDDIAREIYTSAQSRAISLSIGGQLTQLSDPSAPAADPPYVSKTKDGISYGTDLLLPFGSIEEGVRQNYYIIIYNPVTAMVQRVYYWENTDNDFLDTYKANPAAAPKAADKTLRMKYDGGMVGCYDGDDVERALPAATGDSPVEVELFNDEELYLEIKRGMESGTPLNGTFTVTLTDLDKNESRVIKTFNNQDIPVDDTILELNGDKFKLTLDSLKSPGLHFSSICPKTGTGGFNPGCNLRVTVRFEQEGKVPVEEKILTNSLFASVVGDYNPSAPSRTAYISCARHLENLGLLWVYQNQVLTDPAFSIPWNDDLNGVKQAVQTGPIDWKNSLTKVGTTAAPFKPIVNPNLESFNGQGNTISKVTIYGDGDVKDSLLKGYTPDDSVYGVGLFGRFEGNQIQNVNLVDCTANNLTGSDTLHVGLLAGRIDPPAGTCKVLGCHAYAEEREDGTFDCSIKDLSNTTKSAGGLFGSIQNTDIEQSFASLTEIAGSAEVAGGLVGRAEGAVTIQKCYADTGVWSSSGWDRCLSGQTVGGLLGSISGDGFTLENSYAVGGVSSTSVSACGLVGHKEGGGSATIQNCYAALMKGTEIQQLVPADLTYSNCRNYLGHYSDFGAMVTAGEYVAAPTAPPDPAIPSTTHAYGSTEPGYYPFPRLSGMHHYGDWPLEIPAGNSMAYYEVYKKDDAYSIGFCGEGYNNLENNEEYAVVMDGYAVMLRVDAGGSFGGIDLYDPSSPDNRPVLKVEYNGWEVTAAQLKPMYKDLKFADTAITLDQINIDTGIEIGSVRYYPIFLSSAMLVEGEGDEAAAAGAGKNALAKDSYYQKLKVWVDGVSEPAVDTYFNPYVAKSEFHLGTDPEPDAPGTSILRTTRQMTAYSNKAMQKTAVGAGDTFHTVKLERNIDLTKPISTDKTVTGQTIPCKDFEVNETNANVTLKLNGKTLTGTGAQSVVTFKGNKLTVDGWDEGKATRGTLAGGSGNSIDAEGDITVEGCKIEKPVGP